MKKQCVLILLIVQQFNHFVFLIYHIWSQFGRQFPNFKKMYSLQKASRCLLSNSRQSHLATRFPSSFITSSNQVIYRGFSQTQFKRSEEKKQDESRSEEQSQQQQQEEKKSYFKRLFSPANLILPAVFGIVLYNFASYDVRQKKREAELESKFSFCDVDDNSNNTIIQQ